MTLSFSPSCNACALIVELHSHACLCNKTSAHYDVMRLTDIFMPYSRSFLNIWQLCLYE